MARVPSLPATVLPSAVPRGLLSSETIWRPMAAAPIHGPRSVRSETTPLGSTEPTESTYLSNHAGLGIVCTPFHPDPSFWVVHGPSDCILPAAATTTTLWLKAYCT